jgi:hypothetical protein
MTVEYYIDKPEYDGPELVLPSDIQFKVELWRADLLAGVLEVDSRGMVVSSGIKGMPGYEAHLLLGVPQGWLAGMSQRPLIILWPTYKA